MENQGKQMKQTTHAHFVQEKSVHAKLFGYVAIFIVCLGGIKLFYVVKTCDRKAVL
jgi:hypothetical protein